MLAVERRLLQKHQEVGVRHDVPRRLVLEHRACVLSDAREQHAELAALVGEAGEVAQHRRVGEHGLHLLNVEPGAHVAVCVLVHAVADRLAHVDEGEHQHVVRQLLQVEVDDPVVEAHIGVVVEERHGALDEALVAKGDDLRIRLRLLPQDVVEILQKRRLPVPAQLRLPERLLDAALDDGLLSLGEVVAGLGRRCACLRQNGIDLEGNLLDLRHVVVRGGVQRVQVGARVHGEVEHRPTVAAHDLGVLAGTVDHEDLVGRVLQDCARHLLFHEHALSRARLTADKSDRTGELLAVAQHEVRGLLVLPVVRAALVVELLRCERHEDRGLRGREPARLVDVIVAERKDGVKSLRLAEVEQVDLHGVLAGGRDDLQGLVVQFLLGGGVGIEEPREDVHALVLVLQMVEHVLGLFLGVLQLVGQDRVIVSLVHGRTLLVDDLLVDPGRALANVGDGLCLVDRLSEPGRVERDGERNDVGKRTVRKLGAEVLHREDLAPHAVGLEAVGVAFRFEVEAPRRDGILGGHPRMDADVLLVIEEEGLHGVQLRADDFQALRSVKHPRGGVDRRQDSLGLGLDAGKLRHRLLHIVGKDRERDVAVAPDVGNALAELLVQDLVEQRRVLGCVGGVLLHGIEELAAADLGRGDRSVDDAHLNQSIGTELIVKTAHG